MPDMTVYPHGDRWAVAERGAQSAHEEYPTREAAELSARSLAAGGSVEVLDADPTSLEHSEPRDAGEAPDATTAGGGDPGAAASGGRDTGAGPREAQGGL